MLRKKNASCVCGVKSKKEEPTLFILHLGAYTFHYFLETIYGRMLIVHCVMEK